MGILQDIGATKRLKFIDLRHHYIKQTIKEKSIQLKHTESEKLKADIFTKALERQKFENMQKMIDVEEIVDLERDVMNTFLELPDSHMACD